MMIERLNGRTAVAVATAGLLLVALVGWFGVLSPQRSKAAELSTQIDDAELRLQAAQALADGPLLAQSKAELATLQTAIPDEVRMSGVLRQFSRASATSRVRILGITPGAPVVSGSTSVTPITVSLEGRYFAIREFLRLLRAGADLRNDKVVATGRLFGVDSIQFNGGDTDGSVVQATLTVNAFDFQEAAAAPGAATAPSDDTVAEAATP
jgi:Tfp pilus assembly protein PilO